MLFNWIAFSSKNLVLNFSKFSCWIGFIIIVVRVIGGGGCWAISLFCGMHKIMEKWSKFRLDSTYVVDVYVVGFWIFIKKPSIKLICV